MARASAAPLFGDACGPVVICLKVVAQLQQIAKKIKFFNSLVCAKIRLRTDSASRRRFRALDKEAPKADRHVELIRFDGGYGQQRRSRK
jgi:hypothetical protein